MSSAQVLRLPRDSSCVHITRATVRFLPPPGAVFGVLQVTAHGREAARLTGVPRAASTTIRLTRRPHHGARVRHDARRPGRHAARESTAAAAAPGRSRSRSAPRRRRRTHPRPADDRLGAAEDRLARAALGSCASASARVGGGASGSVGQRHVGRAGDDQREHEQARRRRGSGARRRAARGARRTGRAARARRRTASALRRVVADRARQPGERERLRGSPRAERARPSPS